MNTTAQVLVVVDDPTTRTEHRGIVAKRFDVATAASETEALAICRERVPDLVLLDIEMPDLDGIETCRQLREFASVPVIFATGHESLEEHVRAFDAGLTTSSSSRRRAKSCCARSPWRSSSTARPLASSRKRIPCSAWR